MRTQLIGALLFISTNAAAACGPEQEVFMSCQIAERQTMVQVCYDAINVHYSYGPKSGPAELSLTTALTEIDYTPWPGVGRAIWEHVTFYNGDYSYQVHAGFDRMFGDETEADHPTPHFGGIEVRKDDAVIASLTCDRATVDFGWTDEIYNAKTAAGYEWDPRDRAWYKVRG